MGKVTGTLSGFNMAGTMEYGNFNGSNGVDAEKEKRKKEAIKRRLGNKTKKNKKEMEY